MNKKNINIRSILLLIVLIIIGIGIGLGIASAKGLLAVASPNLGERVALNSTLRLDHLTPRRTVELRELLLQDVATDRLLANLTTSGSVHLLQS